MVAKRDIKTGTYDKLGREINVSGNLEQEHNIETKRLQICDSVDESIQYDETILNNYLNDCLAVEVWEDAGNDGDMDIGFLNSAQHKKFMSDFSGLNDQNDIIWVSDTNEVNYDQDSWDEHLATASALLDAYYTDFLDNNNSDDVKDKFVVNAVDDALTSPDSPTFETITAKLWDYENRPDDWDDFISDSDEAKEVILYYNEENMFATCQDGEIIIDDDYIDNCKDELKYDLMELYNN